MKEKELIKIKAERQQLQIMHDNSISSSRKMFIMEKIQEYDDIIEKSDQAKGGA